MNNQIKFWDSMAKNMDKSDELTENILVRTLQKIVKPNKEMRLLDIGCGTGRYSRYYARQVKEVIAIDLSPKMLEIAKEKSKDYDNITYIQGNFSEMDIENLGQFDIIIAPMTPAINEITDLEKINKIGRYVAISKPTKRKMQLEDTIGEKIGIAKKDGTKFIIDAFTYLYSRDYKPYLNYIENNYENEGTVEEISQNIISRFQIERNLTDQEKDQIKTEVQKYEKDNKVKNAATMTVTALIWRA